MNIKLLVAFVLSLIVVSGIASANGPDNSGQSDKIPGQYIVVFKDSVVDSDGVSDELVKANGLGLIHKYGFAIKGFSATIPAAKLDKIKKDPRVQFVSEDRVVYASGKAAPAQPAQIIPTGISRIGNATSTGAGIGVAVIDTGIDLTHPDLKANIAAINKTCVSRTNNANDDNGHGTHVAGTIAALDNSIGVVGVAPQAKLFAVKVLNSQGSGSTSSVICGIDWVTQNAQLLGIKVANMSLGGVGTSDNNCGNTNNDAMHKAICRSRDAGVVYVVAAGNESDNAAFHTPAAYDDAVITVSALADYNGLPGGNGSSSTYGPDDTFASFSNYGAPVDIAAPGVNIFSTYKGGKYATMSGTSMAAPHVAGAAALYIATHPGALWTAVRDGLVGLGEAVGQGHTDPSGRHPENVLNISGL